jgi:hypothetical protein
MKSTTRLALLSFITLQCFCFVAFSLRGEPWKFLIYGDSRGLDDANPVNTAILSELASETTNQQPAFVVVPGDLVDVGDLPAFQTWSNVMAPVYAAGIGVYPAIGNHEYEGDPESYTTFFGPGLPTNGPPDNVTLTYALSYSNVLVLSLDEYYLGYQVNTNWLTAVLATNTCLHIFPMGHVPAFKVNHEDCLQEVPDARDTFWNMLSNVACRVYICGHDHFYDHSRLDDGDGDPSNDIHQYIVGTAGAPLYDDGAYDGVNDGWTPTRVLHERQYGYVVAEIDGPKATFTWYHRTGIGTYAATSDVFSYTLAPVIAPQLSNGALTLTWAGGGTLESAPDPSGPWTSLGKGISPCVITNLTPPQIYYRVRLR